MDWEKGIIIIGVLALLVVASSFTFSVINSSETMPSCEVQKGGGSCELLLELAEGQKLGPGYSFDILSETTHDEIWKDEKYMTLLAEGGPYREEDDMSEYDYEDSYVYLFTAPTWEDVYEYRVEASASASVSTSGSGRAYAQIQAGYIDIPYPYPTVEVCNEDDDSLCLNEDYYLVQNYVDSGGELEFRFKHDQLGGVGEIQARGDSNRYPRSDSGTITTEYVFSSIPSQDARLVAYTEKDNRYYPSSINIGTPELKVSYKEEYFITNMKILLNGNEVIEYPGKIEERIYLPSLTDAINDICGRNDLIINDEACVVKMEFMSDEAGKILIASELGELEPVGGSFNYGSLTGWITLDYGSEPENAVTTTAILLILIGAGIIIYRRVRK